MIKENLGKQNLNLNIIYTVIKELNANSNNFFKILVNLLDKRKIIQSKSSNNVKSISVDDDDVDQELKDQTS